MCELLVPKPLSCRGKNLVLLMVLAVIGIWALWTHFYQTMPDLVPSYLGKKATSTSYNSGFSLVFLPFVSSICPIFILLILKTL